MLLHELISRSASRSSASLALTRHADSLRYESLAQQVADVGSGLADAGLLRRDRVAVYLAKDIEAVVAMFATSAAGGIFVPVNPLLKAPQVGYILRDSEARILVTSSSRLRGLEAELQTCPALEVVVVIDELQGETGFGGRVASWDDLLRSSGNRLCPAIDMDPVAILYTSGSTGRPKGVILSHRNMVSGAESVSQYLQNTSSDRLLAVLPFSFDYGFSQLSTAFTVGASCVLLDYLVPADVIKAADRYAVTGIAGVPPLWIPLSDQEWPASVKQNLRYITNSGGAMPTTTLAKLRASLPGTSVFLMYGLTEAFRSTFLNPDQLDARPTSIGKAIPNNEVLVLRADGTQCDPGEPGELVHRGSLVSLGYWKDASRTAERFRPISFLDDSVPVAEMAVWSGDTVVKDDDGYLYFVGRKDEMIKTAGYRVSPTEIEEAAYTSGIVDEAVALGVRHPVLGSAIVLVAVAVDRESEPTKPLIDALRQYLPNYMLPAHVQWRNALPRNPNGKIDRQQLAADCAKTFADEPNG